MSSKRKVQKKKRAPESYRERSYRRVVDPGRLVAFEVKVRETDLHILAPADLSREVRHLVLEYRAHLEEYISAHPAFSTSLVPLPYDPLAPAIVKEMLQTSSLAGVGPMATVAGVVAEFVGSQLLAAGAAEIVIENGGDIFLRRQQECLISIFAGASPLSGRLGVRLSASRMPMGVCTSSGTVGHSLSFGKADAVTVFSPSTGLADGMATRLGNEVTSAARINHALELAQTVPGITGVVIIIGEQLGVWGDIELAPVSSFQVV